MYVQHFKSVFEELSKTGIDPDQRINDVREGSDPEVIETIEKDTTVQELYLSILKSAKTDMMIILPTANAFSRQEKLGSLKLAQKAAKEGKVKVRILVPRDGHNQQPSERQMAQEFKNSILMKI
jgi:hypothetical protein